MTAKKLSIVAIMAMFVANTPISRVSAGSGPLINSRPMASSGCATCSDDLYRSGENNHYTATWSLTGCPCTGNDCANANPSCDAAGSLNGTYAEASGYFSWNSCASNGCWAEMPHALNNIASATAGELARELVVYEGRIRFNAVRRAIQIYDCRGVVGVHLALSDSVARQLAALLDH